MCSTRPAMPAWAPPGRHPQHAARHPRHRAPHRPGPVHGRHGPARSAGAGRGGAGLRSRAVRQRRLARVGSTGTAGKLPRTAAHAVRGATCRRTAGAAAPATASAAPVRAAPPAEQPAGTVQALRDTVHAGHGVLLALAHPGHLGRRIDLVGQHGVVAPFRIVRHQLVQGQAFMHRRHAGRAAAQCQQRFGHALETLDLP